MKISPTQKGIVRGMVAGATVAIALVAIGVVANPLSLPEGISIRERLAIAAGSMMLLVLSLAIAIGRLARHRFFHPEDIDGVGLRKDSDRANLLQSLLQNTLEQCVLASIMYLSWAVTMPASSLSAVPLAAFAFVIGRILFFRGYVDGAEARALGFALTFYPTLVMLLCNGSYLVWSLFR